MAEVARNILNDGFILLKDAFALSSPGITYTSLHARRKLLRMPLAAIGIGRMQDGTFHYYLVEKVQLGMTCSSTLQTNFCKTVKLLGIAVSLKMISKRCCSLQKQILKGRG